MTLPLSQVHVAAIKPACLIAAILLTGSVCAQDFFIKFNELSYDQGLSSTQNNRFVYHDTEGRVWVSASGGLNRFTGQQNRIYPIDPSDSTALMFSIAASSQFQEDERGDLWFSNTLALLQYDRDEDDFRRHQIVGEDGKPVKNEYYWSFLDTLTDLVYICADRKLYVAHQDSIGRAELLLDKNITSESEMGVGVLGKRFLLGNYAGSPYFTVNEIIGKNILRSDTIFTEDGAEVNVTLFVRETEIYVGTNQGLRVYDLRSGRWCKAIQSPGQKPEDVRSLALRGTQELFVATSVDGIYVYDRPRLRCTGKVKPHFGARETSFQPAIYNIFIDRADNLWVVTVSDGILYGSLNKRKFDLLLPEANGAEHFSEGSDGAVWVNSRFGIYRLADGEQKFYPLPIDGEEVEVLTFIHEDSRGEVWAGSLEWLFKLDPARDSFVVADYLPEPMDNLPGYICFWERPDGVMLFGTNDRAILAVEPGADVGYWIETPFNGIVALYETSTLLYASTTAGIVYTGEISGDTLLVVSEHELDATVTAFEPYLTTDTLLAASLSGLFSFSTEDGMPKAGKVTNVPDNGAQSLEVDNMGSVWLGGPAGLFRYTPGMKEPQAYQLSDGLQSQSYYYDASLKLNDGTMLFGGSKGANIFEPSAVASGLPPARPEVVRILINGDEQKYQEFSEPECRNPTLVNTLRLPYNFNTVELQLSALEYAEPAKCRFRYRLENGDDARFVGLGTTPILRLSQLGRGTYDLLIQASNADGIWSETPRRLRIMVSPPWYFSWWAFVLYGLLLSGLVYGVMLYRIRHARRLEKQQLLTAIAEAQAAETETSVLRLQMNPHFIFNSLNSINNYINKKDIPTAQDYLYKFADLIRDILDRSSQPLTRLDNAMELLDNYLATEQMRIPGLEYVIEGDEEVDDFSTYIPTMILQPFVENAILHGIQGRDNGGTVTIRYGYSPDEQQLLLQVIDDGWGLGKNPGGEEKKHDSKAMKITSRRLELLNLALQPSLAPARMRPDELLRNSGAAPPPPARYEIIDLGAGDATASGTLVNVYLPLTYPEYYESGSN